MTARVAVALGAVALGAALGAGMGAAVSQRGRRARGASIGAAVAGVPLLIAGFTVPVGDPLYGPPRPLLPIPFRT